MIKVTDLSKNFGELKALDKVSFSVPKGSIFGLVGANGAGKSTLMRIIAGIYTADDGSVLINDEPVYDNPAGKNAPRFCSGQNAPYGRRGNDRTHGKFLCFMLSQVLV